MKKRVLAVLLVAIMLLTILPLTAFAAEADVREEFNGLVEAKINVFNLKYVTISSSTTGRSEAGGSISDTRSFLGTLKSDGSWTFTANHNDGFEFTGWSNLSNIPESAIAGNRLTVSYDGDKNYKATANFNFVGYNVTVDLGNGATFEDGGSTQTLTGVSGNLSVPAFNVKDGYNFIGWDKSTNITSSRTLKAKYEYSITFEGNEQLQITGENPVWTVNGNVTAPSYDVASGYRFDGWDRSLNGFSAPTTVTANPCIRQYTITLGMMGDGYYGAKSKVQDTYDVGARITLYDALPMPNIPAYSTFIGWYNHNTGETYYENILSIPKLKVVVDSDCKYSAIIQTTMTDDNRYVNAYVEGPHGKLENSINGVYSRGSKINLNDAQPYAITDGYELKYWEELADSQWKTVTPISNPVITVGWVNDYRAIFRLKEYDVTFNTDGGSFVATQKVVHGSSASRPAVDPTKDNHSFLEWYADSSFTTEFDFDSEIYGNTTVYAKWQIDSYEVSFDSKGGNAVGSQTIEHGSKATEPPEPTKKGYIFGGWYLDLDAAFAFDFNTPITGGIALKAKWIPITYRVAYYGNDATSGSMSNSIHTYDDAESRLSANGFFREGYTFTGWSLEQNGAVEYGNLAKIPNLAFNQDDVVPLYAQWRVNTYTVTYNSNGADGSMRNTSHTYDVTQRLARNRFTKPGYTFIGWSSSEDGDIEYLDRARVVNLTSEDLGNFDLYARWRPNPYVVIYSPNGGRGLTLPSLHTYDSTIEEYLSPNGYWKTGHTFAGWSRSKNGDPDDPDYLDGAEVKNLTTGYAVVLYAQWTVNEYQVTFISNGGSNVDPINVNYRTLIDEPEAPTRVGFNFTGWFKDSELTKPWDFDNDTMPARNRMLYAKWDAKSYAVNYNPNGATGGSTAPSAHFYDALSALTPNGFIRDGYTFLGWSRAADGEIEFFDGVGVKELADGGTIELFAQWTLNQYDVTFVDYDGRVISQSTVGHGSGVTAPPNPTRTGYTFAGWSTKFDAVTSTMTVTAQYSINQYTVTFVDHNGAVLGVSTVNYGSPAAPPANPTRTGYTFTGWNSTYNSVTGHMTVAAQYTINTYTVTFANYNGAVLGTSAVEYGGAATAPANPRRAGYRFTGWSAPFSTITGDMTVTAQYIATYALTVSVNGQGTVGLGSRTYDNGAVVSLANITATPADGFEFVGWQDADGNPISSVRMNADTEIVAVFREIEVIAQEAVPEAVGGGTDDSGTDDSGTDDGQAAVDTITQELVPEASMNNAWLWWLLLLIPAGLLLWWLLAARRKKEEAEEK